MYKTFADSFTGTVDKIEQLQRLTVGYSKTETNGKIDHYIFPNLSSSRRIKKLTVLN